MATLSSPSVEELLSETRNMLNQPSAQNSFWTDEELISYLNEGMRRAFSEIILNGEGQFTTTTDLALAASELVALPSDCYKVKNVWRRVSGGYELLSYRNRLTEGYVTQGVGSGETYLPDYSFRGNYLVLTPPPSFSESAALKLEYVQVPETLVNGGDSMTAQLSPLFRDVIIMYGVWKAKLKESLTNGTDTSALAKSNLNDLFTSMKETVQGRSENPTAIIPFNPED